MWGYRINAGLGDEEALQTAITASLEEETMRHNRPRGVPIVSPDADEVERSFLQVMGMTSELDRRIKGLLDLKFESKLPPGRPIPKLPAEIAPKSPEKSLSASQKLRREQDHEYAEALRQAELQDAGQQLPEVLRSSSEEPSQTPEVEAEPHDGIIIAIDMQGHPRAQRRFRRDCRSEQVYWWAAREFRLHLDRFELLAPGGIVDQQQTLAGQGIANKTLLKVNAVDE
jgi:hypothetical protein